MPRDGADADAAWPRSPQDVVLMRAVGILPVVVHGGGPQIGELMARLGKETEFRNGLRVTDADTLDIARMVLVGKVNRDIVSAINVHGPLAVGMSGEDANLITAAPSHADLGFVGSVSLVDPTMLQRLVAEGLIPVVATIGADESGQAYNINADTVAGALAEALAGREADLPDRHRGAARRGRRPDDRDPPGLARGDRRDPPQRRGPGRHDAQGRGVRPRRARRRRPGAHPRRPGAPCPPARALHRLRGRHDGAAVSDPRSDAWRSRPVATRSCAPTPSPRPRSCGAEGTVLFDADGKEYLDFITGLAVVSLGHAHPAVADAVAEQARTLSHVSNLYGNTLAPEVARTIDRLINGGTRAGRRAGVLRQLGAEANECALKLARRWAGGGRHVVISADNAFHGRTLATLTATGPTREAGAVPPPARGVRARALRRRRRARRGPRPRHRGGRPARADSGRGRGRRAELGLPRAPCGRCAPSATRSSCSTRCRPGSGVPATGSLSRPRGCEPDVVTMAKALGNGMPVGACWARAEVAAAFGPGDHGSTFGGQPLALAAVKATLAVMESEDVCARARAAGARLVAGLEQLPGVVSVRGAGSCWPRSSRRPWPRRSRRVALERGLLVNAVRPDAIRVAPPLLVSDDEIDAALGILAGALGEVRAGTNGRSG